MLRLSIMLALLWALFTPEADAQHRPVIDVHLHAYTELPAGTPAEWTDRREARALRAPQDADEHMRATLEAMDKYNIVLAVASGSQEAIRAWQDAADSRFIGGAMLSDDGLPEHSVDALRARVEDGTIGVFGELGLQYHGIEPADSRLKPNYDYAEIAGVPIALHEYIIPTESYSIEMAEPHVQVLGPDAAVVAFIWHDKAGPGEELPPARAAVSLVFERRSGAWKIPHIHESPVSR